jgi:DDE family transposase
MTECTQSTFEFAAHFARQVVARFDGGTMTTDVGGLLLRETDRRLDLLPRLAECFLDGRSRLLVEHTVAQLVSQRVYGLALGYEDLNDHEQLRQDPPVCRPRQQRDDAGQSTAAVPFGHGLRAGLRLASIGVEGHPVGTGASGHHSHAVAEDRRSGTCECAARLSVDDGKLPLGKLVRAGPHQSAGSCAGLKAAAETAPISSSG